MVLYIPKYIHTEKVQVINFQRVFFGYHSIKELEWKSYMTVRDLRREDWIKEFIKRKSSSWLFGAVWAKEKKTPNCHEYATFLSGFFNFLWAKKNLKKFKDILASSLKSYII